MPRLTILTLDKVQKIIPNRKSYVEDESLIKRLRAISKKVTKSHAGI